MDIVIPEEVEELLEDMPEPQRKAVRAILVGVSYQRMWRGPLPPPDILKQYNDAFPDGAQKIFESSQQQAKHRMDLENRVIPEDQRQSSQGQLFGFITAMSFLLVSGILGYSGHEVGGTILGTVDLVALVTVFVLGRSSQRKSLKGENDDD